MKKVKCVPIVSVRLTTHNGKSKIVSSCEGAIGWWSSYQASWWASKHQPENLYQLPRDEFLKFITIQRIREGKYARRCRPIFERIFGVK